MKNRLISSIGSIFACFNELHLLHLIRTIPNNHTVSWYSAKTQLNHCKIKSVNYISWNGHSILIVIPMSRVYYFEMPVDDFDRAIKFYETVFGWKVTKTDRPSGPYYSVKTGDDNKPGINGSFFKKEEGWSTVSNVINVDDIDTCIAKLQELGGEIIFPKTTINGVGYLAYFKDTEGNSFGMMQNDSDAQSESGM